MWNSRTKALALLASIVTAWIGQAAFGRAMKSDVEQKANGPLHIRMGIWLMVLALGLLCVLTISLPRQETANRESKIESSPTPATLEGRRLAH